MNFDTMELTGGDLYFKTSDGDWKHLTSLTGVETSSADAGYYSTQPKTLYSGAEFSGRMRFVKLGRCKTRKRLVKLLMSKGFQKLAAQEIAWEVNKSPMTYQSYWLNYVLTGDVGIYFWSKA